MKAYIAMMAAAAIAPHAAAQRQPQPTDAGTTVPAPRYESAFAGYRGYRDEPLAPWRDINDEVMRAGGHIGILKSGQAASALKPQRKPAATAPGTAPDAVRK